MCVSFSHWLWEFAAAWRGGGGAGGRPRRAPGGGLGLGHGLDVRELQPLAVEVRDGLAGAGVLEHPPRLRRDLILGRELARVGGGEATAAAAGVPAQARDARAA